MNQDSVEAIKALAAEVGYSACGVTSAEPFRRYSQALDERCSAFPEAAALYARMRGRSDPQQRAPWARSLIVCLRRYGKYDLPADIGQHIGRNYLCDRRCDGCPDHDLPKRFKEGLIRLGLRVRRGGVPDRLAGARAGVTRFGRNGFAYSEHGSWINIETWLADADLPADTPSTTCPCPEGCSACMDACPTRAIVSPYVMRMDRCIAFLTYGAEEPVSEELADCMGKWVYGCDICQQVCPLNKGKWEALEPMPWLDHAVPLLTLAALAEMPQRVYEEVVHPLFWYIPKDRIDRWHTNARRALLNSGSGG